MKMIPDREPIKSAQIGAGKLYYLFVLLVFSLCSLCLVSCGDPGTVPVPVYPNGEIIRNGQPEPMAGWDVHRHEGTIDGGDYYNTGGEWYIVIEDSTFLQSKAVQVYLKRLPKEPDRYNWFLYELFRVSDRFIYIEDPMRSYAGFGYVIFIYTKYRG